MDTLSTLLLGVLQGATEFLPISSSAHLVIAQTLLKIQHPGLMVEIVLHLGTLVSVLVYFRRDLWQLAQGSLLRGRVGAAVRREVGYLGLATVPAVVVALALGDKVEAAFEDVRFSGMMLLVTTAVLVLSRWATRREGARLTWGIALVIGLAQALAILPGISRSGTTIVTGLWLGLKPEAAARFSFLMAIPTARLNPRANRSGDGPGAGIFGRRPGGIRDDRLAHGYSSPGTAAPVRRIYPLGRSHGYFLVVI